MMFYPQFPKAPVWSVAEVLHKNIITNIFMFAFSPQELQRRPFPVCKEMC